MPLGAFKAALMGTAGVSTGDVVLLSENDDTTDLATVSFTSGIDSTYGEYIFKFYNINVATDGADFTFQVNATDGADYNDSDITSTYFHAQHTEDGNTTVFGYEASKDQAQGDKAFQNLACDQGNGSDESCSGELHLFNPASTTYVKNFYSTFNANRLDDRCVVYHVAGYINVTAAIDDF